MGLAAREISEMLPPEPASVGRARRLVAAVISASDHVELVDAATLLVSEVVTNAVLHARSPIQLICQQSGAGVRVEVFDRSPLVPAVRHYDAEAATGRGLALVSALAASWGIDREEGGKTVWFELHGGGVREEGFLSPDVVAESRSAAEVVVVHLLAASPPLVQATIEHGDALLRELALLALGGEFDDVAHGWQVPQLDVSPILAAVEKAAAEGQTRADLEMSFPAGADAAATERLRLVDYADALARQGRLLSAPALPEIAACRHWLLTQIAEQGSGFAPQPWELPEQLEPARAAAGLSDDDIERFQRATVATVVADDANRIILVNSAAGELLGWEPQTLVGQRLIVLIPPELREAHLAGFTRLQMSGEPRILGSTVQVPALRRDGSSVDVALRIEQFAVDGGRRAFCGVLTPTAEVAQEH